jgi:hypothetical protein
MTRCNPWESFAQKQMTPYVLDQMKSLKLAPPSEKAAHEIIRMDFWTIQRDGQIYYTGVRRAIRKFYGLNQ